MVRIDGEVSEMRGSPVHYVMAASLEEAYAKLAAEDPVQMTADGSC